MIRTRSDLIVAMYIGTLTNYNIKIDEQPYSAYHLRRKQHYEADWFDDICGCLISVCLYGRQKTAERVRNLFANCKWNTVDMTQLISIINNSSWINFFSFFYRKQKPQQRTGKQTIDSRNILILFSKLARERNECAIATCSHIFRLLQILLSESNRIVFEVNFCFHFIVKSIYKMRLISRLFYAPFCIIYIQQIKCFYAFFLLWILFLDLKSSLILSLNFFCKAIMGTVQLALR